MCADLGKIATNAQKASRISPKQPPHGHIEKSSEVLTALAMLFVPLSLPILTYYLAHFAKTNTAPAIYVVKNESLDDKVHLSGLLSEWNGKGKLRHFIPIRN